MKFQIIKVFLLAVISIVPALFSASAAAQFAGLSPAALLAELSENIQLLRDAENRITANIPVKDQFAREMAALNREFEAHNRVKADYDRDLARHNADVARYNSECGSGTFTADELRRCEERERTLAAAQNAINVRLVQLNENQAALNERKDDFNRRERERAQAAEQLLTQYDGYDQVIKTLIAELNSREVFRNSNQNCASRTSPEAIHECMMGILRRGQ